MPTRILITRPNGATNTSRPRVESDSRRPFEFHRTLPEFGATALVSAPALAEALGVASVLVKNESERAGLPSFKILGASWASANAIHRAWLNSDTAWPLTFPGIVEGLAAKRDAQPDWVGTLVAATDGNHGRGVARMARLLSLASHILVPGGTARSRIRAIEGEGAVVTVVDGSYDDAIAASSALAGPDALVISDTSWDGYVDTPRDVIDGYSTLFFEIDDALAESGEQLVPTHLVLQAGVGAFASAGLRHYGDTDVIAVIVEPETANCLMESARAGTMTAVPGPHLSSMAGLNCGLPSILAWPTIRDRADAYIAIGDAPLGAATRLLMREQIEAGESGAAGVAGLLALAELPDADELRQSLRLSATSVVLVINTEGATDPDHFKALLAG